MWNSNFYNLPKSLVCLKKSKLRLQFDFRRAPLKGIKKQGERAERAEIKMTAFLAAGVACMESGVLVSLQVQKIKPLQLWGLSGGDLNLICTLAVTHCGVSFRVKITSGNVWKQNFSKVSVLKPPLNFLLYCDWFGQEAGINNGPKYFVIRFGAFSTVAATS